MNMIFVFDSLTHKTQVHIRIALVEEGVGVGGAVESGNGLLNSGLFPQPYNLVTSWEDLHFL